MSGTNSSDSLMIIIKAAWARPATGEELKETLAMRGFTQGALLQSTYARLTGTCAGLQVTKLMFYRSDPLANDGQGPFSVKTV